MKKILIISSIVIVVIVALGVAGFAYAQSQFPPTPDYPYGPGMMGRSGGRGGMMGGWRSADGTYGPLHEYMINAMAEAFDVTPEEIQAAHDEGNTMWDLAQEKGLTEEEFGQLMLDARTKALEQEVKELHQIEQLIWTALAATSHLASFDVRKCKDLSGPQKIDGSQCKEGWTLYQTTGPKLKGTNIPADFHGNGRLAHRMGVDLTFLREDAIVDPIEHAEHRFVIVPSPQHEQFE